MKCLSERGKFPNLFIAWQKSAGHCKFCWVGRPKPCAQRVMGESALVHVRVSQRVGFVSGFF